MSTPVWMMKALPFASKTLSGPGESVTREVVVRRNPRPLLAISMLTRPGFAVAGHAA